jgi:amino-acid N-acetyltransferase
MPRLYIEEYSRALAGKTVCIACREGILRDHRDVIVSDIKFLGRYGIKTVLYHNIPNRFANQKHFRELAERLPDTQIVRVSPGVDFYGQVLDHQENVHKLIFLERKALVDQDGQKINTLTTANVRETIGTWGDLIGNVNFKGVLERICTQIENGNYERVHILPTGKHAIKYELFTIEGAGSLIANNFVERFQQVTSEKAVPMINGILNLYKSEGFLKPRTEAYLHARHTDFYVTLIDDIVVGCAEKKVIDDHTVEIGALAVSTRFRNQKIGVFTVRAFMEAMRQQGFTRVISLTNNPALDHLYVGMGFERGHAAEYQARQDASPNVTMYFKAL